MAQAANRTIGPLFLHHWFGLKLLQIRFGVKVRFTIGGESRQIQKTVRFKSTGKSVRFRFKCKWDRPKK